VRAVEGAGRPGGETMPAMSREECRYALLTELDRAVSHRLIVGQPGVNFARAIRELVLIEDSLVDRINAMLISRRDEWASEPEPEPS
jgi:hypothetical protein